MDTKRYDLIKTLQEVLNNEPTSSEALTTYLNPHSYLLARNNTELFRKFNNIFIDGIALVKIINFFGLGKVERKSFDMTSMAPIVFAKAVKMKQRVYIIGTKPGVIEAAVDNIKTLYPDMDIIGFRDGYFETENSKKMALNGIVELKPDIVICGMGTPLQEKFLVALKESGWKGAGYTCGGFLHQIARKVAYYPDWIDKYNLRWAYRIYDEPILFKRYFWEYPKFLFVFLYDYVKYKTLD